MYKYIYFIEIDLKKFQTENHLWTCFLNQALLYQKYKKHKIITKNEIFSFFVIFYVSWMFCFRFVFRFFEKQYWMWSCICEWFMCEMLIFVSNLVETKGVREWFVHKMFVCVQGCVELESFTNDSYVKFGFLGEFPNFFNLQFFF